MVTVQGHDAHFHFTRPEVMSVYLVGDFNGWQPNQLAMHRNAEGAWEATFRLPPGAFRFGYVADGQWYADYAAFGVALGQRGLESVLCIFDTSPCQKWRSDRT